MISISLPALIPCLSKPSSQPWPPHTHTCFNHPSQMKVRFPNSFQTTFSRTAPCRCGVLPPVKIYLHPIQMKLWCFPPSFQCGFSLPAYDFFRELLNHYQIELVHLNANSILQIAVFVHLFEAFISIPPNFPLFKNYFFLKSQLSATNCKVIRGAGLQTCPHAGFVDLPMKTSLRGWHGTWFYCENHEPSLSPFVAWLLEF
jgi:hypothetical protein